METSRVPVLLYDGECGLCNALMRFMLKNDRRGVLRFAPLQGNTGQVFLRNRGLNTQDFDSLVFIDDLTRADTPFFMRTTGALKAFAEMGGAWSRLSRVLLLVPAGVRDVVYKLVARSRYRIFGRYRPTPLPKADWARRILD
jgi:predicted DCC family thiol-disulfide oxidoreductase YuxK